MAGLTPDGFVAKTYEEIRAGFEAQQRATIDPNLDTSDYSALGQLNGIMATEIAGLWELAEEVYDSFDPDKAAGASQDALYSLTNTIRRGAQKSTVLTTVSLNTSTNILKGEGQASVAGNPSAKFVNDEAMVNVSGATGNFTVRFVAVATGPILANAGTLTEIDTPLAGWNSITNPQDATPGSVIELDSLYRLRRLQEIAAQGGGTVPGMRADLRALDTVIAADVLENDSDYYVGTLPPKSLEAVVLSEEGADDEVTIAETLWKNKTGGTKLFGLQSVVIQDSEGYERTIFFSRPTLREVTVLLRLKTNPALYVGEATAKAAIVSALEDATSPSHVSVGDDVFAGHIVSDGMKLPGVLNAEARVSFDAGATWDSGAVEIAIEPRDIAVFDTSRVHITLVS